MDMERNLLLLVCFVCITTIYFLVPRAVEVLLVQFNLVAYPLREFPKASDLSITFKVLWTPVASGLYYIYRPRSNKLTKCFTLLSGSLCSP
ncbi:CBO0543 family protein [Paenibacillus puerhi]|uniref:CBO0543 family protein n=1 Tax=Paenibacillus puerhi TaxID=2692622 RepID=UPI0038B2CB64